MTMAELDTSTWEALYRQPGDPRRCEIKEPHGGELCRLYFTCINGVCSRAWCCENCLAWLRAAAGNGVGFEVSNHCCGGIKHPLTEIRDPAGLLIWKREE